jgi:hypothetical protein
VSNYGLDDRAIGVPSPAGENDFPFSLCVLTSPGAHAASYTMGTGGPFPGGKARPERDADCSPQLVPRSWMSWSYISSSPKRLHGVWWDCFTFIYIYIYIYIYTHTHTHIHIYHTHADTSKWSLTAAESYDVGPPALFPFRRKACWGFLLPLKFRRSRPGLNPRTLDPTANRLNRRGCLDLSNWK